MVAQSGKDFAFGSVGQIMVPLLLKPIKVTTGVEKTKVTNR